MRDANNHVDPVDPGAVRRRRELGNRDLIVFDVFKVAAVFKKEVMVIGCVGIEIGPRGVDGNLTQQTDIRKLMECIVDRRQRNRQSRLLCFDMQYLRGDMPVFTIK